MSFEGFYQLLCEDGHYWATDCYMFMEMEEEICPTCGKKAIWSNLVDQTNGDEDSGYIELELSKETCCDKCGSSLEKIYKIPAKQQPKELKLPLYTIEQEDDGEID